MAVLLSVIVELFRLMVSLYLYRIFSRCVLFALCGYSIKMQSELPNEPIGANP